MRKRKLKVRTVGNSVINPKTRTFASFKKLAFRCAQAQPAQSRRWTGEALHPPFFIFLSSKTFDTT